MWECEKCHHQNEAADENCWSCGTTNETALDVPPDNTAGTSDTCPNCNSRKVIPNVRVLDRDGDYHDGSLSVRIDRNPNALMMKGSEVCNLKAWICGECGFTQMFAIHPEALWKAYQVSTKGSAE